MTVPLFSLARQSLYVRSRILCTACGSCAYFVLSVGTITALCLTELLSASTAFGGIAVGAGVLAVFQFRRLGLTWAVNRQLKLKAVLLDHWSYARWAVLATIIAWIPWNAHFLILAMLVPLEQVGELRALFNILSPLSHILVALTTSLLPVVSSRFHRLGWCGIRTLITPLLAIYLGSTLIYGVLMLLEGPRLLHLLYAGAYAATYGLSSLVGLIQIPTSTLMVFALLHRAMGKTRDVALLFVPYAIGALILGLAGAMLRGLPGAFIGFVIAAWIALGLSIRVFLKTARSFAHADPYQA
jgi:O-antigen/teichoic acid export membrane protein